ncbi:hypothetical protein Glove_325g6 [Diversispora epigaea]|uniref:Uncharacterized protein n=1 Tax=Diversispora epigaea TaxID=1348612 RepID=A0A397HMK0_9GLOM|nr:hypothetical protein Glove_325g6 [Diversispora epigaea]
MVYFYNENYFIGNSKQIKLKKTYRRRNVCWLDTNDQVYWKTEEDISSEYGKSILLNCVMWFDELNIFE